VYAPDRVYPWPMNRPERAWPRLVAALPVFVLGVATYFLAGCSSSNGLRKGIADASVDLHECVPDVTIGCACASGQHGVQVCTSAGTFPPCQCATPDGADNTGGDSAVESDGATRMDKTPDSPDSMVVDSAIEPDGAASIDTANVLSCYHSLDGLLGVIDYACQSDEDCTTILIANKCFALCWLSINVANVAAVEAAEDQLCQPFLPQQCRLVQPPCRSVHAPSCVAGSCQTEYGSARDAAAK
jgi:hypothetical protein